MDTVTQASDVGDVRTRGGLYRRLLGPAADRLDDRVADLHCARQDVLLAGRLHVRRGSSPLARLGAAALRLPPTGERVPTRLLIVRRSPGEHWIRMFGDSPPVCSWQHASADGQLVERFGRLRLTFARGRCRGLELPPARLLPRRRRAGHADTGRSDPPGSTRPSSRARPAARCPVRVQITAPVVGSLLTYTGPMSIQKDRP